tara:strand:+ start:1050 stop:1223 length:174 start_codon:yes stop_codon:yes gene_type:complete
MSDIKKWLVENILLLDVESFSMSRIELYGLTIKQLHELYYVLLAQKEILENQEPLNN